jgi:hypothetical protein
MTAQKRFLNAFLGQEVEIQEFYKDGIMRANVAGKLEKYNNGFYRVGEDNFIHFHSSELKELRFYTGFIVLVIAR